MMKKYSVTMLAVLAGVFASFADANPATEFETACKEGRPMAAEKAFKAMCAKNPDQPVENYLKAAEMAVRARKQTVLRDRMAYILRKEAGWNDVTEVAATALAVHQGDYAAYLRLLKAYPQSKQIRGMAEDLYRRYYDANRAADLQALADGMVATAADQAAADQAVNWLYAYRANNRPGFSVEELKKFLMKYPLVGSSGRDGELSWLLTIPEMPYLYRVEWVAKYKRLFNRENPNFFWSRVITDDFNNQKCCPDEESRVKATTMMKQLESTLFLNPSNFTCAVYYFRRRMELNTKYFAPAKAEGAAVTNEFSKKTVKLYELLLKSAGTDKTRQREMRDASERLFDLRWTNEHEAQRLAAANPYCFNPDSLMWKAHIGNRALEKKDLKELNDVLAKTGNAYEYRISVLNAISLYGSATEAQKTLEEYMIRNPRSFAHSTLLETLKNIKGMSDESKAGFVNRMLMKVGYSKQWDAFATDNWRKAASGNYSFVKDKAFDAVVAGIKAKPQPEYALLGSWYAVDAKQYSQAVEDAVVKALSIYTQPIYPKEGEDKDPLQTTVMHWILDKYQDLAHRTGDGQRSFIKTMVPRMTPNGYWWGYEVCVDRLKNDEVRQQYYRDWTKMRDPYRYFGSLRLPKDSKTVPAEYGEWMKKTSPGAVYNFYEANRWRMTDEGRVELFNTVVRNADLKKMDRDQINYLYHYYNDNKIKFWDKKELVAKLDFEPLAKAIFDEPGRLEEKKLWLDVIKNRLGRAEYQKYLPRVLKSIENRTEPIVKLNEYLSLAGSGAILDFDENAEKGSHDEYGTLLKNKVLPLMKAVPSKQAALVYLGGGWSAGERLYNYYDRVPARNTNATYQAWVSDYKHELARLYNATARGCDDIRSLSLVYNHCFRKAFSTTNTVEMSKYAARLGASWYWNGGEWDFNKLCNELKEAGCWESLYLIASNIYDKDAGFMASATKMRSLATPHLPGIYPVNENDPSYPLYVAADELMMKNSERAWDLLQKNIATFEREAMKLPPDFVAWGVEQLRLQRGDKDALLLKARTIATALLANEAALTPELAASMLLVRAESYRDQQNFEAAKLEYQSVRNNKKYEGTKAGRKAMFRQVDLMIDMGGSSAAESTLEYWLSQPDTEIQAEAHYFLARIAFERKDFDECIKQLRETFALDFTHTEARFLQGKWKLATNSEVDDTDVMIGTLADRTAIRPGQQLSITVQDRNLSVAGGGASIPVIVTTTPGKDAERVYLYPSARDPNLFKGVVDVKLGKAVVSNMVLEVSGRDRASYVIDPDFLKARGLPLNEPKVLSVIDDAKLEIENETLRPGNPIYVQLEDKDRSVGGEGGEVTVKVTTSSGDVVEAFPLKEVKPYTGIFRGEVPTALPPPRAFASDTAVGVSAGDVINENKKGEWKSLADGQPGKWIEVDTMGSHMMKTAKIQLPDPESVREIALYGRLGGETIRLGSLPDEPVEKRVGLRVKSINHSGMRRNAEQMRSYFNSLRANQYWSSICEKGVFCFPSAKGNQWVPQQLMWNGVFVAPKDKSFARFRVTAKKTQGDTFRNLWISVSIDGEQVLTGQGPTLHGRLASVDLTPGAHELEVCASLGRELDGFDLEVLDDNDEGHPLPMDWFDAKKNPEIEKFLQSKAEIKRTATGFTAEFAKAQRLRSLRWEFIKRTTPDVTVSKLEIVNNKDEVIIPCKTDFTDAQKNSTLEVAPGDKISVAYVDEVTTSGEKRILERSINSSFNNAKVGFFFEESVKEGSAAGLHLREAVRFHAGDKMLVGVYDPDQDVSGGADTLVVRVTSSSGEKKDLKLLESKGDYHEFRGHLDRQDETQRLGVHTGLFLGLLKTADEADTNAVKALKVKAGEALTLSYNDRENTNPGVPFVRQAKVLCVNYGEPKIQLFHTRKAKVVDNSPQAKARLEKIRRRPGNEQVKVLYRDVMTALPMDTKTCAKDDAIDVNVATPVPIRVIDPSRARHSSSRLTVIATAESEAEKAKAEGRKPESVEIPLVVGASFPGFSLKKGGESPSEARRNGSFNGVLELCLGVPDPDRIARPDAPPQLQVTGSDTVTIKVMADDSKEPLLERKLRFVSNGAIALMDSTWNAERMAAHVGDKFYVSVEDADMDATDEADTVKVEVKSTVTNATSTITLTETLPHSGIFTGTMPSVRYGDKLIFTYNDERVLPGTQLPRHLCVTGTVYSGSDGSVRLFSKRFRDNDAAVLVQFRLAECLFEQAKEHRQLAKKNKDPQQTEKAQDAIAKGKYILEEALKNYPDSQHVVQGEYLLANLYQELATEQKDAKNMAAATPLFTEALARFSTILSAWPESEFAAKAQYHKALCLEMLGDYPRASEEYVKMTYLYPDSDLVGDATIRLATYYYKQEKRYDIAGRIYENFQKRFPTHEKAPRTLFMSGSCYIKQGEAVQKKYEEKTKRTGLCKEASEFYRDAAASFSSVAEKYRETASPEMRAQALYWTGDAHLRRQDYQNSYLFLKRTVFEYPETEWARRARGLLLQESRAFDALEAK